MTSNTLTKLKPVTAIVCEDIRIEGNGKAMLIGVFAESIVIPVAPANIRLALWVTVDVQEVGDKAVFHFKLVQNSNDKILAEIEGEIGASKLGLASFPVGNIAITINESCSIELLFEDDEKNWASVVKKDVVVAPISPSIELPPPS